jgi:P4 family phage/plasmid primase-like protien
MRFKDIAQLYIDKEISVTPINNIKMPYGSGWNKIFLDQILTPENDWKWAQAKGLGLLTGEPSKIILLDIDLKDDETNPEKIKIKEQLLASLPPIFSGRNGSKQKPTARFFKYEGQSTERFTAIDIEILSTGVHCALPPSYHSEGHNYEWVGKSLLDIDVEDLPSINDLKIEDEELSVWLRRKNLEIQKKFTIDKLLRSEKGRCKSGSHTYLSRIGVAMRYEGYSENQVINKLMEQDSKINSGEDSLYFKCKSRRWNSKDSYANAQEFVSVIFSKHQPSPIAERYPTKKDGFFFIELNENGSEKKTPDYIGLNKYMRDELCLKTKDDSAFIFNDRFYEPISKQGIESKIYEITNLRAGPNHLGNMARMARVYSHYAPDFVNPPGAINVANGILYTDTMELRPHDKDKFFTYRLKHDYVNSLETPVFDKFLRLISTGDETKETLIKEFIGYILSGCDYSKLNNILILDGAGANGKTSLINIIETLVGVENCSSESLTSLKENRFSAFSLVGKLVNFCAEEPKEAFGNSGALKKLTGNDPVMIEPKHMRSFSYINYAKFIISYNEMPFLADRTAGMRRRLLIVPCVTDLEKNPELKINNLMENILPECGAIMHKCLLAFNEVKLRWKFTKVQAGVDRYKEIELQSDVVLDFVKNRTLLYDELTEDEKALVNKLTQGAKPHLLVENLWDEFQAFAGDTRIKKRGFEMRISQIFNSLSGVKKERMTSGVDRNKNTYTGICLTKYVNS